MTDYMLPLIVGTLLVCWVIVVIANKTAYCEHSWVRCVHGDEINNCGRRAMCLVCGYYLPGGLPEVCSYTGKPHWGGDDDDA